MNISSKLFVPLYLKIIIYFFKYKKCHAQSKIEKLSHRL